MLCCHFCCQNKISLKNNLRQEGFALAHSFIGKAHSSLTPWVVAGACGLTCVLVDLDARFQAGTEPCSNPLAPPLGLPAMPSVQKLAQLL